MSTPAPAAAARAPEVETLDLGKRFGDFAALTDVSQRFAPGCFHAILGENGAGKSTLAKCILGYHPPSTGSIRVAGTEQVIRNPRHAHHLGLGMVYQHFTLVPGMSVAENLVLGVSDLPLVVPWSRLREQIHRFVQTTPFRLDLDRQVSTLAAGEKQKLEILKQLYLGRRFLILDEPTSVLTPAEADQILGLMGELSEDASLSVVLITHKLREVRRFARTVSVLRGGRVVGGGAAADYSDDDLAELMVGRDRIPAPAARDAPPRATTGLQLRGIEAGSERGVVAVRGLDLVVRHGEIVGVAGVSGNGQRELVEVLAGQRARDRGEVHVDGAPYEPSRRMMRERRVFLLPEEPLHNACVRSMSVAENLALRDFDSAANTIAGVFVNRTALARQATRLIDRFRIHTQGANARLDTLSGGNVQRCVLARELSRDVAVLVVQNPCFGLDLSAVAEIRNRIVEVRNSGAAVLLISEDLDELLDLSDRILVMFEGRIVYETAREHADVTTIGRHMASHEAR